MPNIRYDRINEEVKKTISEIVREMKDPRISPLATMKNPMIEARVSASSILFVIKI